MLSRISKMSVFGIVALMLAFGLVTTDALAQTAVPRVTIEATATTTGAGDIGDLRATDSATLTFTVQAEPHGTAADQKPGQVRIIIPSQWSSPLETVGVVDEAREVSINTTGGDGDLAVNGSISGRHLVVDIGKSATGTVTFVFMTVTPPTMRRHGFELRSTAHAIVDDADIDPVDDEDQIRKRGGRYYLDIDVGPIRSGASPDNNFTLSGGGNLHLQPNPDEKPPPHAGMYLAFSNASIPNLRVSYKVPGTMPKDSTFIVTLVSDVDPDRAGRNLWELSRKSDASPSSNIEFATDEAGAVLTGKLKSTLQSGTISFTLRRIKAPKVEGDEAVAITGGYTIQAQTSVFYDADGEGGSDAALEAAAGPAAPFGFVFTKPDGTGRLRVHAAGSDAVADGNVVTHHVAGSDLGGLTIVLDNLVGIAGGSAYEIAFPQNMGWPEPYEPIGAAQDGALSGALTATILPSEAGAGDVANAQTNVVITYQVDKASTTQGPHVFNAKVSAGPHGNLKALGGHTIHMTADHGTGTVDLIDKSGSEFVRAIDAAEVGNLRFRYKPAGYMAADAAIQITLPDGWTRARTDNPGDGSDDPGEIAASSKARVDVADNNYSITVIATEAWNLGDTIVITYKNVKVADIADGTTKSDTFVVASRSFGSGAFKALAASPIVGIGRDPDGSGSIALSVTETDTATAIGTLMITYTAAGKMEIGSVVEVTVPDTGNWPNPAIAANLSISNVSRASLTATAATETAPATMSATTSTELGKDDTIIFVYKNISAQPAGTHTFSATSTVTYDGAPNPLFTGPADITVNPVVPGSVALTYVKDEMIHPLTNAAPGADLGQLTFTFTAEAPMESGSQVQITVPNGWWPPFRGNTAADSRRGAVWVAGATVAISPSAEEAGPWTITATPDGGLAVGDTLAFTYNAGAAPSEGPYPFTTMASVASGGTPVSIATSRTVIVRELVAAITITAEPTSVFVNEDINVTVALQDADGQPARALSATDILLSDGEAGGSFSDADGNAVTSIPMYTNASSASATYSNASDGMIALTATLGEMTDSADVEVKSTISNLQVNGMDAPLPLKGDATITVSAKGIGGADVRASVTVTKTETDADGNQIVSSVVSTKSLDEVPAAPDAPEDDVAYTRDIDLGGLVDGDYTVTVNIGDDSLSIEIAVLNNQEAPTLSDASATPVGGAAAIDEGEVVLSVTVTPNASMVPIALVEADVSELDSTRKDDPVALDDADGDGTYSVIFAISTDNAHDDGEVMVSFTATDSYDNESDALTASITLRNDYDPPVLTVEKDDLGMAKDGDMLTIVVESEPGLTVTANAESVGGGMMVMFTEGTADESNGNGDAANGNGDAANGNGDAANGNGDAANGNGDASNGNGDASNGNGDAANGNGMAEAAPGNGVYTGMVTVSGAEDGEQTITITGHDDWPDNVSEPVSVTVMIDNTGAMLSDASADPTMATNDMDVIISVDADESGLTITANAESIGGGMVTLTEDTADESNGNGNGDAANGNGNGADMADSAMVYSYSGTATVTDAEDGEQTITITATDALGNESEAVMVSVTVDNTGPTLSDANADPAEAVNGGMVTISVSSESGLTTVMADASAIGGAAEEMLTEEMDADMAGTGTYSVDVEVTDAEDGEQTITITATDALGNESEAVMVSVTVDNTGPTLSDANADPAEAVNGGMVTISVSSESGLTTVMADASAIGGAAEEMLTEEMDADMAGTGTYSVDVEVTDAEDGEQTITITATDALGNESEAVMVSVTVTVIITEVEPSIRNLSVDNALVKQDSTITVSVTGKAGGGTVTVLDSEGETEVAAKALDPDGEPDEDGDQAYTRSITLPEVLADGTYTVSVEIQGEMDSSKFEVVNDQAPPTLSEASARPVQTTYATNGKEVVLSVTVELNDSNIEINSVTADVSALDSTLTVDDPKIELTELPTGSGRYTTILTISSENMRDDGEVMVSFIATDRLGNESEAATASIRLKNDVTAPELSMESAMPSSAANDMVVTISVSSEPGLTVTADATAIGGDAAVALDEGMDANGNGNGMDANGNGNGMDANGNGNGMDANGNGNGMDANGNGNGMNANGNGDDMTETAMPAGNGVYSGMVTVTAAEDGEQTITITATDGSGNASTATVSVTIDNTGAMLSDASADPTMATNDTEVILSVNGGESGLTVTADASAIGGGEVEFTEGMDDMYSATVTVTDAEDGEQMVTISATDALGNASEAVVVSVTVDNSGPTLSDASADPAKAVNGDMVTISVMGGESGLTVMADASELGAEADVELAESSDTAGSYSGTVEVNADSAGDKMVSITATDALGNASEAVTVMVSVHEVTSVSFSPAQVSTGDTVTVTAVGTAGLTATFSVFDAEAMNIVDNKSLTESTDGGTYEGSFEIVADAHPTGEYWVSASVGKASMTAENALTIDHKAQFTLSIAAGTHAIHVPLDVTHIDGEAGTIETVGDLYDALGESVNFIITLGADGNWTSYLGDMSAGSMADAAIGDDTGLIAVMKSAATLELTGNALGTGGVSQINIEIGNNLVGIPLDPVVDMMISGALVEGVRAIAVSNAAGDGFHTITAADDTGDGPLMGGVGYIVVATAAANIPIVGSAWENEGAPMAAPGVAFGGSQTPVLHVEGGVMDEFDMLSRMPELRVTVRNLSTGASLDTVLGTEASTTAYSATFVEFGRHAAKAGDVLEIVAHSPNPYVGVRPVPQIVVSAEEVLTSRISLPDMELYEIPSESELLANYPNPFNPETWIPYRLAKAAEVTLDIYDTNGRLVRTIDIGFKPAAVYESRASAIYWDGRNNYGERVASGTYFYHLTAGDDYASTRRMVILK